MEFLVELSQLKINMILLLQYMVVPIMPSFKIARNFHINIQNSKDKSN